MTTRVRVTSARDVGAEADLGTEEAALAAAGDHAACSTTPTRPPASAAPTPPRPRGRSRQPCPDPHLGGDRRCQVSRACGWHRRCFVIRSCASPRSPSSPPPSPPRPVSPPPTGRTSPSAWAPATSRTSWRDYADTSVRVRLGAGHRFGNLAVEGFLAGDVFDNYEMQDATTVSASTSSTSSGLGQLPGLRPRQRQPHEHPARRQQLQRLLRLLRRPAATTPAAASAAAPASSCAARSAPSASSTGRSSSSRPAPRSTPRSTSTTAWTSTASTPATASGGAIDAKFYRWTFGFNVGQDF